MSDHQLKFIRETLIAAEAEKAKALEKGDALGAYAFSYGMLAGAMRALEQGTIK